VWLNEIGRLLRPHACVCHLSTKRSRRGFMHVTDVVQRLTTERAGCDANDIDLGLEDNLYNLRVPMEIVV